MPEILPTDVAATPAAAPAPAAAAAAPAAGGLSPELTDLLGQDGEVPEDVLRIPAFNALLEGKPGAVYTDRGSKDPEVATIIKHAPDLIKAGFGFYQADSKPVNVLFNSLKISPEELAKADSEGRLDEVAAPFSEVKDSFDKVIASGKGDASAAPEASGTPTVPGPSPAPAPASVMNKIATARTDNLTPGSPTSGPAPGQGRILNALRKSVV